jgi:hypothetical protein
VQEHPVPIEQALNKPPSLLILASYRKERSLSPLDGIEAAFLGQLPVTGIMGSE